MIKALLFLCISLVSTFSFAQADKTFGVGVLLGDPTALSGKLLFGTNQAVDGGIAFSKYYTLIFADYLQQFPGALGKQNSFVARLTPYVGIGPLFAFSDHDHDHDGKHNHHNHDDYFGDDDDDFGLGARIPFGIEWMAPNIPLGVSLELVPGLMIIPHTDAFLQAGLAIRYYF